MKALIRNRGRRGFTLIELMIVVAIIGILAVLAIYGVSRYLKTSKTAEATNNIGQMAKSAQEAFTRETMSGALLAPGASTQVSSALCLPAAAKVPVTVPKASKYSSKITDWDGDSVTGWKCLRFTIDQPQYYQYEYASTATTFNSRAYGDLDGNSVNSTFDLAGAIVGSGATQQLTVAPTPAITDETE